MRRIRRGDIRDLVPGNRWRQGLGIAGSPSFNSHASQTFQQIVFGQGLGNTIAVIKIGIFYFFAVYPAHIIKIVKGLGHAQGIILSHIRCRTGHVQNTTHADGLGRRDARVTHHQSQNQDRNANDSAYLACFHPLTPFFIQLK